MSTPAPVVTTTAHVSALQTFEAIVTAAWSDVLTALNWVAQEAPTAAAIAEVAATATGNVELDPIIAGAAAGVQAVDAVANATSASSVAANANNLITSIQTTVAAAKGTTPTPAPAVTVTATPI